MIPVWNGKELKTWGDIGEAMESVKTKEDGAKLMAILRKQNPKHADSNVGYITGYYSAATAKRMRALLGVRHPLVSTIQ